MRIEGYCSWVCLSVCLLSHISPLERLFILKNTATYSSGNRGRKICGDFSETALWQRYTASCIVRYCSGLPYTFSTAEPSKGPKKANNRLNSTWNTTGCKVASFFLFSLCLLPKVFRILPVNVDLERAPSRICVRASYAEGSALQCIHCTCMCTRTRKASVTNSNNVVSISFHQYCTQVYIHVDIRYMYMYINTHHPTHHSVSQI